jgi:hypothetical protein
MMADMMSKMSMMKKMGDKADNPAPADPQK